MKLIKTVYKTTDGAEFDSVSDAKTHQVSLSFELWYQSDPIPGCTTEDAAKWLKRHKDSIEEM